MSLRVLKPENEERETIKAIVLDLAEYYSIKLSDKQVEMYVEDLLEMGSDNVLRSALLYRREWNSKTFPFPAQLRKQIFYSESDKFAYL